MFEAEALAARILRVVRAVGKENERVALVELQRHFVFAEHFIVNGAEHERGGRKLRHIAFRTKENRRVTGTCVAQFSGARIDCEKDARRVEAVASEQAMEVAIEAREKLCGPFIGVFVTQSLDFAVNTRDAHRACKSVAGYIDEGEIETLIFANPGVDEVAADFSRGSIAEIESHPFRREGLWEKRLMHRARLLILTAHLEESASDETSLELALMPLKSHVTEEQCRREDEGDCRNFEDERKPCVLLDGKAQRKQQPAREQRHDRFERLTPRPRKEERGGCVPEEDREQRRRGDAGNRDDQRGFEHERDQAEDENHPRSGGHELCVRLKLSTHHEAKPANNKERWQAEPNEAPPREDGFNGWRCSGEITLFFFRERIIFVGRIVIRVAVQGSTGRTSRATLRSVLARAINLRIGLIG